jgi:peptidoglycan hydrolase CwlO-like protein
MTYVIGGLAMLVSLVALWLASSSIKKIEDGNREIKSRISADVDKVRQELEKKISGIDNKVVSFDSTMKAVMDNQAQSSERLDILEKKLAKISRDLSDLTSSIPPQFRTRSGPSQNEFG